MKNITEKIKGIFASKGNHTSSNLFRAGRDWKIIIFLFFVMFLGLLYFDYLNYKDTNNQEMFVSGNGSLNVTNRLKTGFLNQVENYFSDKADTYSSLGKKPLIDPSL